MFQSWHTNIEYFELCLQEVGASCQSDSRLKTCIYTEN